MIGDSKTEEEREWKLIKVHKDRYFLGFIFLQAAHSGVLPLLSLLCCGKGLLGIASFSVKLQTLPAFREVSWETRVMWLQLLTVPR